MRPDNLTPLATKSQLDASHTPVRSAAVQLESLDTAERRSAITGDDGVYAFASVPPGHYRLTVQASGFGELLIRGPVVPQSSGGPLAPDAELLASLGYKQE